MKKTRLILALTLAAALGMCVLAGCSSDSENSESTGSETEIANPIHESDQAGVLEATGLDLAAPKGATGAEWSYIDSEEGNPIAQLTYTVDNTTLTYRAQATDLMTVDEMTTEDLPGYYIEWEGDPAQVNVSHCDARAYLNDEASVLMWIDAVPGIAYSLATDAAVTDVQLTTWAEQIFVSAQGEV